MSVIEVKKADAIGFYITVNGVDYYNYLQLSAFKYLEKIKQTYDVEKVIASTKSVDNYKIKLKIFSKGLVNACYKTSATSDAPLFYRSFIFCLDGLKEYFGEVPKTIYITW